MQIRIVVAGACGRMGQEVTRWINKQSDMKLVGAHDIDCYEGKDIGRIISGDDSGITIGKNLKTILEKEMPECLVDFTNGKVAPDNILNALTMRIPSIVGATGIDKESLLEIEEKANEYETPVLIAPNFSLGAVLMMKFSAITSKYFEHAEIIELHHDKKLDAPSGTAIRTAQLMTETGKEFKSCLISDEKIKGARGGLHDGINIHSIRLPGFLAHQEVIFGGEGEVLTIKHDSTARSCFMPGVMLAIRRIKTLKGLTVGLEHILDI